jgi:hypothetical protein
MRSFGTLVLAFFVSIAVAGIVQNQLAVAFGAREEFIAVMMLFALTALTVTFAFAVALGVAKTVSGIDWTALGLLIASVAGIGVLVALGAAADRKLTVNAADLKIIAEILVPTALLIGIQWWFVRRRRRAPQA